MIGVADLPLVNAVLNATTATLLVLGYVSIRRGRVARHRALMISAFAVSVAFLASYLTYHWQVGSVRFTAGAMTALSTAVVRQIGQVTRPRRFWLS